MSSIHGKTDHKTFKATWCMRFYDISIVNDVNILTSANIWRAGKSILLFLDKSSRGNRLEWFLTQIRKASQGRSCDWSDDKNYKQRRGSWVFLLSITEPLPCTGDVINEWGRNLMAVSCHFNHVVVEVIFKVIAKRNERRVLVFTRWLPLV